jgi:hypothetical protein
VPGPDKGGEVARNAHLSQIDRAKRLPDDAGLLEDTQLRVHEDEWPAFDPAEPSLAGERELESFDPDLDARHGGDLGEGTNRFLGGHPRSVAENPAIAERPTAGRTVGGTAAERDRAGVLGCVTCENERPLRNPPKSLQSRSQ